MLFAPVSPEVMRAPATTDYLRAVAADVPALGNALPEAIVSHGYGVAALAYSHRFAEVYAYGAERGWTTETTEAILRHALTTLLPYAIRVETEPLDD